MYGGTAKTYCRWKVLDEPFKEKTFYYVHVEHPVTKLAKKVRWYRDKAHAELMPAVVKSSQRPFAGTLFGFEGPKDYVLAIKERGISKDELAQYFYRNWEKNDRPWKFSDIYGGIWYAPRTAAIPPIKYVDKVFHITWKDFVLAAREHARKYGFTDSFWNQPHLLEGCD